MLPGALAFLLSYNSLIAMPIFSHRLFAVLDPGFFVWSRFDVPLELDGPTFANTVVNVESPMTRDPGLLETVRPGWSDCDYVIVESGIEAHMERSLRVDRKLESIGAYGGYEIYRVRRL